MTLENIGNNGNIALRKRPLWVVICRCRTVTGRSISGIIDTSVLTGAKLKTDEHL